jgi:CheY-like chemotaxis protein/class 3 adenylate cyclase
MQSSQSSRTIICSVVFADLIAYSTRSVADQIGAKQRFNALLAESLQGIPVGHRIALDTGDGAAICFLGDPEDALYVAMHLRDRRGDEGIRIGIHLGPVTRLDDINGQPNVVGDGINAAQRVMSFAQSGQVVASRAYRDVVTCLSSEYETLFAFHGAHRDKHVREHEIYVVGESESAMLRAKKGIASRAAHSLASSGGNAPARRPRAIIAEDEQILREELTELLAQVWPELEIVAVVGDGLSAVQAVEAQRPDVAFLDIQMPGMTGIEVARAIGERVHVVFTTANDSFAIQAFEEGAVEYVLKPFGMARLVAACRRVKQRLGTATLAQEGRGSARPFVASAPDSSL